MLKKGTLGRFDQSELGLSGLANKILARLEEKLDPSAVSQAPVTEPKAEASEDAPASPPPTKRAKKKAAKKVATKKTAKKLFFMQYNVL